MRISAFSQRHLIFITLGLAYIALGLLGALPAVSLIQLARNTHVSLEVAGFMFAVSSIGGMLGIIGCGILIRSIKPKYLLMLGILCPLICRGWQIKCRFVHARYIRFFAI